MIGDVVLLPHELQPGGERAIVVLDVLRATTSIAAALAAGVPEVRVFQSLDEARRAAAGSTAAHLLCGEERCLRPEGFDLGNSPGQFQTAHAGKLVFMSTTNGTRAIIAAQQARILLVGAIVNAAAVARALLGTGCDFVLLCAGTDGQVSMEDVLGAGAVLDAARQSTYVELGSDCARIALRLFHAARDQLRVALAQAQGGQNVIRAGLDADIDFAARLNSIDAVGVVHRNPLRAVKF